MSDAPKAAPMPTFDDWYWAKHRWSFDSRYLQEGALIAPALKALAVELRAYVSEMVQHEACTNRGESVSRPCNEPATTSAPPLYGDAQAMQLFRTFVRDNAPALRMVAHWGDGHYGALVDVLCTELDVCDPAPATPGAKPDPLPLFPDDGGSQ